MYIRELDIDIEIRDMGNKIIRYRARIKNRDT